MTTVRVHGRSYSCFIDSNSRLVVHEQQDEQSTYLELMDGTSEGAESWGEKLPIRLKYMHSHWLSREKNVIVLRPRAFHNREVHYLLTLRASDVGWRCWRIPCHKRLSLIHI